jgi:GntR family transcriptional regulator
MQVADALIADIEQGTYGVGDMLPPELEIAEKYGVSRYTAREAIRRLTEMGLITRRAGIGTTVKSSATQSRYTARISDIQELIHYTKQTELKLLKEEWVKIEGELAAILEEAQGQTWLKISALRYPRGSDKPISLTDMVVHPSYARIRERIHEPNAAVYKLIEEIYGEKISEVRQEISCLALSPEVSALLGAAVGSPALLVLRYYLGKGNSLMSVSINIYPQDRFKLSTSWRLDWA